ncbi:proline iminopeptidase [Ameyamaea chiangmaiensis NBRC 103196]|uniref:Proline iminopeptidase n=1 Tax=Ameyamaea chiangmaiensis TaxID=442969 RepID=A0A850PIL5_9PROT|nr:prolyl aminopeptidase [Ameyamaea chiangmaiensis]MBS4074057.1 prolyl aminopeptidase [Ameyamaea chiangmaiensis]NVN41091.1 prolyl aminopeptidase [Ameyamaea chiangmaiensis]GBQ67412.1 proline iminopeptidase [Ameyamaea chiangmaiensis NBRC 103196]
MVVARLPYPAIEPFDSGWLEVGDGHRVYWETSGRRDGIPVVVLHGGPGGGSSPAMRRMFDPARYCVVLFDQRGCGRSTPYASLEANTTWHLVGDVERLRHALGVDRWLVYGGSWGSTLALAYAQTHPQVVSGLILRGIFTARREEVLWYYQQGASWLFPDAWESFVAPIPPDERSDLIGAYHRRLTGQDEAERVRCAVAWSRWEGGTLTLRPTSSVSDQYANPHYALAFARIENHYFQNGAWLEEGQLLRDARRLADIPGVIVQGRYDVVTPMHTAWALHRAWPEAALHIVDDAGHATAEAGIMTALLDATDAFAARFQETAAR